MTTVKWEGFKELDQKLRELADPKEQGKVLRAAAAAAGRKVAKQAKANIPVGTRAHTTYKGRLVSPGFARRSIRVKTRLSRSKQSVSVKIGVKREAFYAAQFIELGTAKIAARPWLRPALESNKEVAIQMFAKRLRERIHKVAASRAKSSQ